MQRVATLAGFEGHSKLLVSSWLVSLVAASATPALAQQFEPRPGLEALVSGATGVFEIGAVEFGQVEAMLRALVHNGQVLQVHSRQGGEWLAKRAGSVGGKTVAPTTLDELATIAGGLDVDVSCGSSEMRADFSRAAKVVLLDAASSCDRPAQPSSAVRKRPPSPVAVRNIECNASGCQVSNRHAAPPSGFQVKIDPGRATWSFEGYGIVAVWSIPEG